MCNHNTSQSRVVYSIIKIIINLLSLSPICWNKLVMRRGGIKFNKYFKKHLTFDRDCLSAAWVWKNNNLKYHRKSVLIYMFIIRQSCVLCEVLVPQKVWEQVHARSELTLCDLLTLRSWFGTRPHDIYIKFNFAYIFDFTPNNLGPKAIDDPGLLCLISRG